MASRSWPTSARYGDLATSGRDRAARTKRFAARVPDLDILSQGLIERLNGGWRTPEKGRAILALMPGLPKRRRLASWVQSKIRPRAPASGLRTSRTNRRQCRGAARARARAKAS